MVSNLRSRWVMGGSTFILWGLVAASGVYWALKLTASAPSTAAPVVARTPPPADPAAMARLLGASPAAAPIVTAPSVASRFSLVGVVASRGESAAALIAVDGKPPKPFRVGNPVDQGLVLQSVEGRRAVLAATQEGPAVVTLELPPLPR